MPSLSKSSVRPCLTKHLKLLNHLISFQRVAPTKLYELLTNESDKILLGLDHGDLFPVGEGTTDVGLLSCSTKLQNLFNTAAQEKEKIIFHFSQHFSLFQSKDDAIITKTRNMFKYLQVKIL